MIIDIWGLDWSDDNLWTVFGFVTKCSKLYKIENIFKTLKHKQYV